MVNVGEHRRTLLDNRNVASNRERVRVFVTHFLCYVHRNSFKSVFNVYTERMIIQRVCTYEYVCGFCDLKVIGMCPCGVKSNVLYYYTDNKYQILVFVCVWGDINSVSMLIRTFSGPM